MFDVLIHQLRSGEPAGALNFYKAFAPGVRLFLRRTTRLRDVEDLVYDTLLQVTRMVRNSATMASEQLTTTVRATAKSRAESSSEGRAGSTALKEMPEAAKALLRILSECAPQDREILLRFYFLYESDELIAAQLNLSIEQVRACKLRVRSSFRLANAGE